MQQQRSSVDDVVLSLKGSSAGEALERQAAACTVQVAALRAEAARCRAGERLAKDEARHQSGQAAAERLRVAEIDTRLADNEAELQLLQKRVIQVCGQAHRQH